jgi:imidazole glycerol-phosphate synthase subunit HisH
VIAIVDYGIGNLGSVSKAFRACGADVRLTAEASLLRQAAALVLPGDGAFGAAMQELRARGLASLLCEAAGAGTPILGICIGMQLLLQESEEHGLHPGLGLLAGRVRRIPDDSLPVPHMGWNRLHRRRPHPVLDAVEDGAHVYFVHSYYCDVAPELVLASTDYGIELPAAVGAANVLGLQFHPEKSQGVGLRLIAAVLDWVSGAGRLEQAAAPLPRARSEP